MRHPRYAADPWAMIETLASSLSGGWLLGTLGSVLLCSLPLMAAAQDSPDQEHATDSLEVQVAQRSAAISADAALDPATRDAALGRLAEAQRLLQAAADDRAEAARLAAEQEATPTALAELARRESEPEAADESAAWSNLSLGQLEIAASEAASFARAAKDRAAQARQELADLRNRRPLVGAEWPPRARPSMTRTERSTRSPPRAGRLRTQAARKSSRRRVRGHPRRGLRFSRSSAAGPICASSCWKRRRTLPSARSPLAWRVSAGFARNSLDAGCRKRSLSRRSGGNRSSANTKPSQPSRARTRTWQDNTRARVRFSITRRRSARCRAARAFNCGFRKRCNGASCAIGRPWTFACGRPADCAGPRRLTVDCSAPRGPRSSARIDQRPSAAHSSTRQGNEAARARLAG